MDSDMTLETKSKSLAYDNVPEMNTHYDADFSPDDSGEEYRPEKVKRTYPVIGRRSSSSSNSSSSSSCTSSSSSSSKNTSTQSVAILSQNQPFILNQDNNIYPNNSIRNNEPPDIDQNPESPK
ncbi:unnamed protein product [Parnassius apollo]|uniref:(apollo) hypothetical protein n=1 Tax=Parnassius apollo TaxID=110799 RepID=A0A8S3W818_PARAO|nr:unnamed protein product [Parnassius apollo]